MCTVVLLLRPGHQWPLIMAANRDEMLDRPWDPPAEHWPDRPGVVAGRDRLGGGTWMGINRHHVIAAVLNRQGSLGPRPGKRSRGELPLIALEHATAEAAAGAIAELKASAYRRFNMVVADAAGTWFLRGLGQGHSESIPLESGLHMVTARDPNDPTSPRVARHLDRFRAAASPEPPDQWNGWAALVADRSGPPESQLNIVPRVGFGTVCSSLAALAADGRAVWQFAPGAPDRAAFAPVQIP
jgi:hypothetical protein